MDPAQLAALAAAVDEGTFDAAATLLGVTPSAISQRIKALETSVGQPLLNRTKPVRATAAGQVLLRLARQVAALTADTLADLGMADSPDASPVAFRLAADTDSLATWLPAGLHAATAMSGPSLAFDIRDERHGWAADLLRDGTVMAAVTSSREPAFGCDVRKLGVMHFHATASPELVAARFSPAVTALSLLETPSVVRKEATQLRSRYLRRVSRARATGVVHQLPDVLSCVQAIVHGLGWGLLPAQLIDTSPLPLVRIDPDHPVEVAIYWHQWRLPSAALERVAAAVREAARASLT